ncbi:hypothetical protein P4K49_02440 [Bacillus cereus]|uniref:hypothetical protein n=1 Tax=Bacillus thuringiensis TaxID=1428 RepID=UPI000676C1DB|nr:hypothetical protein [Bacillus thuringiensis]MEB8878114.1 hypothetical protein [Bacillus cereus]HDR7461846.1 hypothetical protein [Bacillus toyonensis]AKR34226.1 Hypothetical protein NF53_1148 [Bacillus thuringiensis serovar indiana]MEB9616724.1 hypothetical protein [Bacillus cereus]MEB9638791.1 hypothetical protein [Bacillus cereus]
MSVSKHQFFELYKQRLDSLAVKLDKHLKGEFVFTSNEFAYKLNEIYNHQVKYNKLEFARLLGFEHHRIDDYFDGKVFPTLEQILRATAIFNLPSDYFFTPTLHMEYPIWLDPLVTYCIIEKVKDKGELFSYDKKMFFSSVLQQLAVGIIIFRDWLYSDSDSRQSATEERFENIDTNYLYAPFAHLEDWELYEFKRGLEKQYYEILKYCPSDDSFREDLTFVEQILNNLIQENKQLVCRIVTESIKEIHVQNGKIDVKLHFIEDIINGKSVGRHYLPHTLSLEFIEAVNRI